MDQKTKHSKVLTLPKLICSFKVILIEINKVTFFIEINKLILKFIWKNTGPGKLGKKYPYKKE